MYSKVQLLRLAAHAAILFRLCLALPTVVVDSGKAKCVTVESPQDTVVRIKYDAPDVLLDEKQPGYGATYITVNTIPSKRVVDTVLHMSPVKSRLKPTTKTITEANGTVIHRFEVDGIAMVCIRSSTANEKKPQRFGLRIDTSEQDPRILLPSEVGEKDVPDVDKHLTHMERELQRITIAMNHVLREADFNKDQDALFHKQTLAMHSAITFWPIVQVCILLITGFTQANHIVRFFKSRRIV